MIVRTTRAKVGHCQAPLQAKRPGHQSRGVLLGVHVVTPITSAALEASQHTDGWLWEMRAAWCRASTVAWPSLRTRHNSPTPCPVPVAADDAHAPTDRAAPPRIGEHLH